MEEEKVASELDASEQPSAKQKAYFWDLAQRNPEALKEFKKPVSLMDKKECSSAIEFLREMDGSKEPSAQETPEIAKQNFRARTAGFNDAAFGMCYKAALYEAIADHKPLVKSKRFVGTTTRQLFEHYMNTRQALKEKLAARQDVKA